MRNPFPSEPDAFRFLLLLIVALAPAAIAAAAGPAWLALTLLVFALVVLLLRLLHVRVLSPRGAEPRLKSAPAHVGAADERRILVVANDTLGEHGLAREIERLASSPHTHVRVLAPALVSSPARWTGGFDRARAEAQGRLDDTLGRIRVDLDATGEISDADPLQAIEDTLATFAADEIVIATRRERSWNGLEPRLADLVRERFALPIEQLVFDTETA